MSIPSAAATPGSAAARVPFSTTLIYVEQGNPVHRLLAVCCFFPYFVLSSLGGAVVVSRNLQYCYLLGGLLVDELVNHVLKYHVFQQPRPSGAPLGNPGMPSSHAQFCAFLWVACVLGTAAQRRESRSVRVLLGFGLLVMSILVCVGRVTLGFHTEEQVLCGVAVGGGFGAVYVLLLRRFGAAVSTRVEGTWLGRFFLLRDVSDRAIQSCGVPGISASVFEYEAQLSFTKKRWSRKLVQ